MHGLPIQFSSIAKQQIVARPGIALGILVCGGIAYLALCQRAIHQYGYPPLDPFYEAMRYLWIPPIILSALLQRTFGTSRNRVLPDIPASATMVEAPGTATVLNYAEGLPPRFMPLPPRWLQLAIYACLTAIVDAASGTWSVPRFFDPFYIAGTVIFWYGPLHLAVAAVAEFISQLTFSVVRRLIPYDGTADETARGWLGRPTWVASLFGLILITSAIFPCEFAAFSLLNQTDNARRAADRDWAAGRAFLFTGDFDVEDNWIIDRSYDFATGLPLRHDMHLGFEDGYNARIRQLVRANGPPAWGLGAKRVGVSKEALIALLDDPALTPIPAYPFNASPNVVLFYGWCARFGAGGAATGFPTIATPGMVTGSNSGWPVYYGTCPLDHSICVVRYGNSSVYTFSPTGDLVATACRR